MSWIINYTPLFYMDGITYACPNPDAGLVKLCHPKGSCGPFY